MIYLLDTNICIYLINRKSPDLIERIEQEKPSDVGLSSITVSELYYGVYKSVQLEMNLTALAQFLMPFEIVPYMGEMAEQFGKVRAALERRGKPIGGYDMLIAAQALYHDLTLVTNNVKEFNRIPELKIENWLK